MNIFILISRNVCTQTHIKKIHFRVQCTCKNSPSTWSYIICSLRHRHVHNLEETTAILATYFLLPLIFCLLSSVPRLCTWLFPVPYCAALCPLNCPAGINTFSESESAICNINLWRPPAKCRPLIALCISKLRDQPSFYSSIFPNGPSDYGHIGPTQEQEKDPAGSRSHCIHAECSGCVRNLLFSFFLFSELLSDSTITAVIIC